MTTFTFSLRRIAGAALAMTLLFATGSLQSCKDEVDASNLVTKTEATVWDYLDSVAVYSDYADLLTEVETGDGKVANSSTLASFVSGYGNFTVFPPTNDALAQYTLDITGGQTSDWRQLSAEDKKVIAYNSIIDHGDDPAYATADLPTTGSLMLGTLDNRLLAVELTADNVFLLEGTARIVRPDIKLKNGYIHGVDAVIAPSQSTVADLIATADNMKIFSLLLERTGWADSLRIPYEDPDFSTDGYPERETFQTGLYADLVEHRYRGFTVFAEPDSVYEHALDLDLQTDEAGNVTDADAILAAVEQHAAQTYGTASMGQYADPANPLNRFVAYHLLDGAMAWNKLVMHMNEFGYEYGADMTDPQLNTFTVDVSHYYTTKGHTRCLLKVTQNGNLEDGVYPIYLNTARTYDTRPDGNYEVLAITSRGQKLSPTNGAHVNSAVNGFYYPIDGLLQYDDDARTKALYGRIRFDVADLLPEMWTVNKRGCSIAYFTNDYFDNIVDISDDTDFFYLKVGWGASGTVWYDLQGDEFQALGIYDLTFRLPPVPVAGTYEMRMAYTTNPQRGMAQIYFGDDPRNLVPTGLPLDMRLNPSGGIGYTDFKESNPEIFAAFPWETDVEDQEQNRAVDKNLRNAGYMKGAKYYHGCASLTPARDTYCCQRRIITQQYMEPEKTYYVRFKSALEATDGQFILDNFELCPSYIYNGPEGEDVW